MRADLDERQLRVVLAWDLFHDNSIRHVEEQNPEWYRMFCAHYSPSRRAKPRRGKKPDTYIKRAHTLRALGEIASSKCKTVYALRLLPYVKQEIRRYKKNGYYVR